MKKIVTLFLSLAMAFAISGCDNDEVFDADEQLQIDIRLIDQYLDDNSLVAQVDEVSNLRYIVNHVLIIIVYIVISYDILKMIYYSLDNLIFIIFIFSVKNVK